MNFFEKKLAKQFADHLVQKFANGETVKIPEVGVAVYDHEARICLLYTSPSPRD